MHCHAVDMHLRTLYSPGQTQRPPHVARVNSRVQAVRCIVGQLDRVLVILGDVKGDRGSESFFVKTAMSLVIPDRIVGRSDADFENPAPPRRNVAPLLSPSSSMLREF